MDDQLEIDRLRRHDFIRTLWFEETVGSTNTELRERIGRDRWHPPILMLTEKQTAGRGRGNHRWWAGPGSLAFSVLINGSQWNWPEGRQLPISLAVGVAMVEAIQSFLPNLPVGLHWPNDLYIEGQKIGGILIEGLPKNRWILGIGVNINNSQQWAPLELRNRLTSLIDLKGKKIDRTEILEKALDGLAEILPGLSSLSSNWSEKFDLYCSQKGEMLQVFQGEKIIRGICEGIAADGGLRLMTEHGQQTVYTGSLRSD
ncbi:Biotin--[acetyl-CoA-carboxylase] ligase [Planctomycetales bacterium 10988]|nr:Biotin--[acetyl-CoA-carboxylase] ligase [Planctomycetales bacterium 10988]